MPLLDPGLDNYIVMKHVWEPYAAIVHPIGANTTCNEVKEILGYVRVVRLISP